MHKRGWAATAAVTVVLATAGTTAAATGFPDRTSDEPVRKIAAATEPDHAAPNTDWTSAGQNLHDTRNSASEHILNRRNVTNLKPRWVYTAAGSVSATPTVAHGVTYVPDWGGHLSAVSTATGKALWSNPISKYSGVSGDTSRTSPAYADGTLVFGDGWLFASTTAGAYVMGANAATGAPLWRTKVDDNPDAIITSSPVIDRGVAYVGVSSKSEVHPTPYTFRGSVVALSVATGKVLWKTRTVPVGYTGGSMWASTPVVDHETGLLFVDTGNNYSVPPGVCTRPFQTGCTPPSPDDHIDSILALRLETGRIAWSRSTLSADSWTIPHPEGPDYDFGSGPNLYTTEVRGKRTRLLGAGQKSGVYWAVDPATGRVVWQTQVGPGGIIGGIEFGTATDGRRVYVAIANSEHVPTTITSVTGQKTTITSGFFAALDAATGKILWQTADPKHDSNLDLGAVSSANGVAYAGSTSGDMYALDGATGTVKWSFASGAPVAGGPAVVNGSVYWGSGYYAPGSTNNKLYAFSLPRSHCDQDGTRHRCRVQ